MATCIDLFQKKYQISGLLLHDQLDNYPDQQARQRDSKRGLLGKKSGFVVLSCHS